MRVTLGPPFPVGSHAYTFPVSLAVRAPLGGGTSHGLCPSQRKAASQGAWGVAEGRLGPGRLQATSGRPHWPHPAQAGVLEMTPHCFPSWGRDVARVSGDS